MMKRSILNKIALTSLALILFLLFLLFPKDKEYHLELNTKNNVEYVSNNLIHSIYLLDKDNYLGRASILLKGKTIQEKIKEIVDILIIDGKRESMVPSGFRAIIPSDTKVNSVTIEEGIVYCDFSKEFMDVDIKMEEKIVEAIVYSLTSQSEVKGVSILLDGKPFVILPKSGKRIAEILDRSYGINKSYDINRTSNIADVTIYYLNKYNDNYYYVPVTKYINTTQDKIKIIVEELTSGPIYETNLISFLNANAKLLNYQQTETDLTLHFNNYLFDDMEKQNVLEEVIYSIALSVYDNYDVGKVVFLVDNTKFTKSVSKTLE